MAAEKVSSKCVDISVLLRSPLGLCFLSPMEKVAVLNWQLINALSCNALDLEPRICNNKAHLLISQWL